MNLRKIAYQYLAFLEKYDLECRITEETTPYYNWETENDFPDPLPNQRYKLGFDLHPPHLAEAFGFGDLRPLDAAVVEVARCVLECLQNDSTHAYVSNKQFPLFYPDEFQEFKKLLLPEGEGVEIGCIATKMTCDSNLNRMGWRLQMIPHNLSKQETK